MPLYIVPYWGKVQHSKSCYQIGVWSYRTNNQIDVWLRYQPKLIVWVDIDIGVLHCYVGEVGITLNNTK